MSAPHLAMQHRLPRLAQPGPVSVCAGEAVVDVDPLGRDAERGEGVSLRCEVLIVGRDVGRSRC